MKVTFALVAAASLVAADSNPFNAIPECAVSTASVA